MIFALKRTSVHSLNSADDFHKLNTQAFLTGLILGLMTHAIVPHGLSSVSLTLAAAYIPVILALRGHTGKSASAIRFLPTIGFFFIGFLFPLVF